MENNTLTQEQALASNEVLKLTALLYFQEALLKQEYEACPGLISIAKNLGAENDQIDRVIAGYLRGDKAGGNNGANRLNNRRFS